jgi:hypothetical protein
MLQHQKITLVFPSLNQLWGFVRDAKINYVEFNEENFTLVCNCPQADIDHAKERFGALEYKLVM